ncbi:ABC transporter substrate-binding protein [Paenibacillus cremeus]|uniref:Extracellular solute-binding protein n=1 Tax=Paenibacillus cremeus TaxID=2163881 RepID=A0A559JHP1_9BACL|nr:extracellular solute-binding protein [Paenibacillus cremeus]TVX99389.1 extracellular solute-binding protein [Paenibacillus cremeus]
MRIRSKQVMTSFTVLLSALLVLAGCSSGTSSSTGTSTSTGGSGTVSPAAASPAPAPATAAPAEKVRLKLMFQKGQGTKDYFGDWMQENISLFKAKNPNIDFEVIANTCCDNYLTVITTDMAANNLPDIFQGWTLERMRPFAEAGRLLDLTSAINENPDWKTNMSPDALKGTTFNGKVYGLPLAQDAEIVYYNKEVFAKNNLQPPKTYDELLNIIDVLKKAGITPITMPNKEPWVGTIPYMMLTERIGGLDTYQATVMDKKGSWKDQPFLDAGQKLQELIKRGAFEENVNSITTKESEIKLSEGKAGMYAMGTWSIAPLYGAMKENLGFFNFPDISGGKGSKDHYLILPNSALSVSGSSKHPKEALEFMKFVFSQERQLAFAKLGYLTAYNTKVQAGDLSPFNEQLIKAINAKTGLMYPWDVPLGVFMGKELNNTTQSLYTGANPSEAFDKLQKTAESQKK